MQKLEARYGKIENEKWNDESKWMTIFNIPNEIGFWINTITSKPTKKIYCNRDLIGPLNIALKNVIDNGLKGELRTFDGCFMIRAQRGTTDTPSMHSYGIAIDLNARLNPLGADPVMLPEFVKCWTDAGWTWGGNFKRKDGMHFEYTAKVA